MDKEKMNYYNEHEEELPNMCYTVNRVSKQPIIVKKGETGYYPLSFTIKEDLVNKFVKDNNNALGVTEEQQEVMYMKSLFGWKGNC